MCRKDENDGDCDSATVVDVVTYSGNGRRRWWCGRQWWREGSGCVCVMGGQMEEGGDGKVTYLGGSKKCVVLKEGARIEEVRRVVTELSGIELSERKVWYNLKYDRELVMALEGEADVRMFFKGNEEHGYLFVGDSNGRRRRQEQPCAARGGETHTCYKHKACVDSGVEGNGEGKGGRTIAELKR